MPPYLETQQDAKNNDIWSGGYQARRYRQRAANELYRSNRSKTMYAGLTNETPISGSECLMKEAFETLHVSMLSIRRAPN